MPHQPLVRGERPALRPEGSEKYQVLLVHGDIEGLFPADRSAADYGGALISLNEIGPEDWTYVALGHYHVQHEVVKGVWYAGALEYVSPNLWGELIEEDKLESSGKGWLQVDLARGGVQRQPVPRAREILDLEPIQAQELSSGAVDALIASRVEAVPGGIADKIVRLRVFDIPRHVARELNHSAIRALKTQALHFHLDLRRPDVHRMTGVGAPNRRQTLPDLVATYLKGRPLPAELDRDSFVRLGQELMDSVERDLAGG